MAEHRRCAAITSTGTRCERVVHGDATYCYSHDPQAAERRKKAASKGARAKNGYELTSVKDKLRSLAADVESGKLSTAKGSVAAQIYGVLLRAFEQERKQKEVEEFEERLAKLESM